MTLGFCSEDRRSVAIGRLRVRWAHIPVDGWLPHYTPREDLEQAAWLIEWRRLWVFWV